MRIARIEIAGRLVGENHRRLVRERARDRDALLLAAGERRRQLVRLRRDAERVEQLQRARSACARAEGTSPQKSIGSMTFSAAVSVGRSWKN